MQGQHVRFPGNERQQNFLVFFEHRVKLYETRVRHHTDNQIWSFKIMLCERSRGCERLRGRSCSLTTHFFMKNQVTDREWITPLSHCTDCSSSCPPAPWANGVTGSRQASSLQASKKQHQSALWFASQILDRNLRFWLTYRKSPDPGFLSDLWLLGLWYFLPCCCVPTEPQPWAPVQT